MRRVAVLVGLTLLLGFTTSVGLAWLRATLLRPALSENKLIEFEGSDIGVFGGFEVTEYRSTGATYRVVLPSRRSEWSERVLPPIDVPDWSIAHRADPDGLSEWRACGVEKEFGWPLRCLRVSWPVGDHAYSYHEETLQGGVPAKSVRWGMLPTTVLGRTSFTYVQAEIRVALPMTPIVWPLLANTIVLSLPWFVVTMIVVGPGVLVRWRRARADRCVRCAYPTPGSGDPCPECGLVLGGGPWVGSRTLGVCCAIALLGVSVTVGFAAWRRSEAVVTPPVVRAAADGDTARLAAIIEAGGPIDDPLSYELYTPGSAMAGARPLVWAASRGHAEAARLLLDAGADPNANEGRALDHAARRGETAICALLLARGADHGGSESDAGALVSAIRSGNPRTIALLQMAQGRFARDADALIAAARYDHALLVRMLDEVPWNEADLSEALWVAVGDVLPDVAEELILAGGLAGSETGELLWHACEVASPELVRMLIEYGVDANYVDTRQLGRCAIRRAVVEDCAECVRLLLEFGADPFVTDSSGESLIHHARSVGVLEQLLRAGLGVELQNPVGFTPLMAAARDGRYSVARALFGAGADPTAHDDFYDRSASDYARGRAAKLNASESEDPLVLLIERAAADWTRRRGSD